MLEKVIITELEEQEIQKLVEKLEKMTLIQVAMFKNLKAFQEFYNENIDWHESRVHGEINKFTKFLAKKLEFLRQKIREGIMYDEKISIQKNWKELINQDLDNIENLSEKEKVEMKRIIQMENITEIDEKELISILSKLDTKELISILGDSFKQHTKKYIRWGWDFYRSVKSLILTNYISVEKYRNKKIKGISEGTSLQGIEYEKKALSQRQEFNEENNLVKINDDKNRLLISNANRTKISKELKEQIVKYTIIELKKLILYELPKNEILNRINIISNLIYKDLNLGLNSNTKKREFLQRYIRMIVWFLTKAKLLKETDRVLNIKKLAKETYNKEIVTLKTWQVNASRIITYLENDLKFEFRRLRNNDYSQGESLSLKRFKNFYEFIKNRKMTYLYTDYKTEININYDGKCYGINGYCEFGIDYHYLPALSLHHLLANYKDVITKKKFKYLEPSGLFNVNLKNVLKKLQTQIGGLALLCKNHQMLIHNSRYNYPPIFSFLQSLRVDDIDKKPSEIIQKSNKLSLEYYKKFIKKDKKWYPSKINRTLMKDVKKKYVIEFIFGENYQCPICKKVNINEHLPCFLAHHTNLNLFKKKGMKKIYFKKEYPKRTVDWLIENIIMQECIFICQNCHEMLHITYYRDLLLPIFQNKEDVDFVNEFYEKENTIIKEYRIKKILVLKKKLKNKKIVIEDPLGEIFSKSEILERNLICIYYICKIFSKESLNMFTSKDIGSTLGKEREYFRATGRNSGKRPELLKEKYIKKIMKTSQGVPIFKITVKGIKKVEEINIIKSKKYPKAFFELIATWEIRYKKIKRPIREEVLRALLIDNYTVKQLREILGYSLDKLRSAIGDLKRSRKIREIGKEGRVKIWGLNLQDNIP